MRAVVPRLFQARMAAPFAVFGIRAIGERLTGLDYLPRGAATLKPQTAFANEVCRQIAAYLKEPRFAFDLPFDFEGTEYQCRVWKAVHALPPGEVLSCRDLARRIGGSMHSRRGAAIGIKRWLLHHENPGLY